MAPSLLCADPVGEPGWDALVMSHPDHCLFHSAAWARVLQATYGHRAAYWVARQGERLLACLPLMEVNSAVTGRRGVSLPFTDLCPPLTSEAVPLPALFAQAREAGETRRWKYLELRGSAAPAEAATPSLRFYGHELPLGGGEEKLFSGLESGVRRAIRKAEKEGVKVEIATTSEAVRTYYALHCLTRQKHGLPPQPFAFFRHLHEHLLSREMGFVSIASYMRQPIAAAVFLHLGRRAVYKFGASDETRLNLRGNNLAMWEAIRWYARHGYESLHLGRTSLNNEGLRRYKLGWGVTEQTIEYFKWDCRRRCFVTETDKVEGWYNRVFSLLPRSVSRWIGGVLYKHVA